MTATILRYNAPAIKIAVEQIISIDADEGIIKIRISSGVLYGYHIKIEI